MACGPPACIRPVRRARPTKRLSQPHRKLRNVSRDGANAGQAVIFWVGGPSAISVKVGRNGVSWEVCELPSLSVALTDEERTALKTGLRSSDGVRGASLPDGAGQRPWRAGAPDRGAGGLRRENGAPTPPSLQSAGAGGVAAWLLTSAPAAATGLPGRARRAVARAACTAARATSAMPTSLWTLELAAEVSFAQGLTDHAGHGRSDPDDAAAAGHRLEARQALDHQPRSGVCPKKRRRDRLIALAAAQPDWALGFADEVWWSRLAQPAPAQPGRTEQPLRLVEQTVAKDDPDPKALACYGLLAAPCRPGRKRSGCASSTAGRSARSPPVPGLVLPEAGGAGRAGVGADLGQRLLARE